MPTLVRNVFLSAVLFVSYVACQSGDICCLPKQWEGDLVTFQELGQRSGYSYLRLTSDSENLKYRYDIFTNDSGALYYFTVWDDYHQQTSYTQNNINYQCFSQSLSGPPQENCLEKANFTKSDELIVGTQKAQVWIGKGDSDGVVVTMATRDCIPISANLINDEYGFNLNYYYNITQGISDPSVLTPCTPNSQSGRIIPGMSKLVWKAIEGLRSLF